MQQGLADIARRQRLALARLEQLLPARVDHRLAGSFHDDLIDAGAGKRVDAVPRVSVYVASGLSKVASNPSFVTSSLSYVTCSLACVTWSLACVTRSLAYVASNLPDVASIVPDVVSGFSRTRVRGPPEGGRYVGSFGGGGRAHRHRSDQHGKRPARHQNTCLTRTSSA